MSEPRQCEEYPVVGHRCGLPRGHPGAHDIDPAPQDAWDWVDEKDELIATLRRELDEARADLDAAESRKAQAFRDLKGRAEAAESALSEARKESAGLREALRDLLLFVETREPAAAVARARSLLPFDMLPEASPRETAPAAAPPAGPRNGRCRVCGSRWVNGRRNVRGVAHHCDDLDVEAAAPHNPQSNRSTNNEE